MSTIGQVGEKGKLIAQIDKLPVEFWPIEQTRQSEKQNTRPSTSQPAATGTPPTRQTEG